MNTDRHTMIIWDVVTILALLILAYSIIAQRRTKPKPYNNLLWRQAETVINEFNRLTIDFDNPQTTINDGPYRSDSEWNDRAVRVWEAVKRLDETSHSKCDDQHIEYGTICNTIHLVCTPGVWDRHVLPGGKRYYLALHTSRCIEQLKQLVERDRLIEEGLDG